MRRLLALLAVLAPLLAACGGGAPAASGPIQPATEAELRLAVIEVLGPRWYCDPDEYPVAHGTEQERAIERYEEMVAEDELFAAVAAWLGIDPDANHNDAQKLALYRLWKVALSIPMEPAGEGRYRFDYTAQPLPGATEGVHTTGTINADRTITNRQQEPATEPICPICLSIGTLIDTPDGPVAVNELHLGDPIWTLDAAGHRVAGIVIALGSTSAPATHHVVRLRLDDGRSVSASPGHPLADGRAIGSLGVGDIVDGGTVVSAELVPYAGGSTFDLLASGETGGYLAGGIPLASTLRPG